MLARCRTLLKKLREASQHQSKARSGFSSEENQVIAVELERIDAILSKTADRNCWIVAKVEIEG